MTKRTTIRKPDLASQARLKADQRQRQMLRKGEFLRSQGAPVVLTQLPFNGLTVMIRRVDLVVLASSGSWPEPISSRVAQMVRLTPGAEEHYATAELERQSLAACAAVAKACVVVPPEAFMAGEIDEAQIDLRTLKPFFVDEDPDEDQVILRVLEGELLPAGEAADAGALHHRDLVHIMTTAYLLGPGGLGKFFVDKTALWRSWQTWQQQGMLPSSQLGIDYPWVAQDLNRAVAMLGSRVREDYDKALEAEREGRTTVDEKGRKKRPTLTDAERDNIWAEVHSRVVRDRIVFHIRKVRTQKSAGGGVLVAPTEDWIRIEKPITGDPDIDNRKNRGERVVTDLATGKVLEHWNADGERVM